ncbi:MAG: transporter, family, 3-phenylpropionic acid transporter [Nocardioidaceae bacterium]|nr:transporter, family, 3-phenylpropionic acid transporter [Nocardioidaceae bacterium]
MSTGTRPAVARPELHRLQLLYAAMGASVGSLLPYLVLYLTGRGLSPTEAGLVIGTMGAVGVVAVPLWGVVADRTMGTVGALRASCALAVVASAVFFAAGDAMPAVVVGAMLLAAARAPGDALSDSLTVAVLGDSATALYGHVRLWASIGFAVAVGGWGLVLARTSVNLVLLAFPLMILVVLASTTAHRWPSVAVHASPGQGAFRDVLRSRLPFLLGGAMLFGAAMGASSTALPLRLVDVGGGVVAVAAAAVVGAVAEIPFMRSSGSISRRLGLRAVFLVGGALFAASLVMYGVLSAPVLVVLACVLRGAGYALVYVALVTSVGRLVPVGQRATGQALLQTTMMGLAPIVGSSLGGYGFQHWSPVELFGGAGALALVGAGVARLAAVPADAG